MPRGTRRNAVLLQQQHLARLELSKVVGDRTSKGAGPDHHGVHLRRQAHLVGALFAAPVDGRLVGNVLWIGGNLLAEDASAVAEEGAPVAPQERGVLLRGGAERAESSYHLVRVDESYTGVNLRLLVVASVQNTFKLYTSLRKSATQRKSCGGQCSQKLIDRGI